MATYTMKRTQIYIDEDQDARLEQRARAERTTRSSLIRAAIDAFLREDGDRSALQAALDETAGALPDLEVPSRDEWERGYD